MPIISIPKTSKEWKTDYIGDFWGDIVNSSCDLSYKQGYLTPTGRFYPHSVDTTGLTIPTDFAFTNAGGTGDLYWTVSTKCFRTASLVNVFTLDALTNSPTSLSDPDMKVFYRNSSGVDVAVVSRATDLAMLSTTWDKTWWTVTLGATALKTGYPHPLGVFQRIMFVGDKNAMHSIIWDGTTYTVIQNELTFNEEYSITWIKCTKDKIYIGLKSLINASHSMVTEYDYFAKSSRSVEITEGNTIGWIWNNNLHIVDEKGNLRQWTGSNFQTYASFPTAFRTKMVFDLPHRNGISIMDGKTYMLVPGNTASLLGGIWVYDPEFKKLYRHYTLTFTTLTTNLDYGAVYYVSTGALFCINSSSLGYIFAGAGVYKDLTNVLYGVFSNFLSFGVYLTDYTTVSYFITPKINVSNVIDNTWRNILVKYDPKWWGTQTGKITVKYKIASSSMSFQYSDLGIYKEGTWINSTKFTISSVPTGLAVGDEVFIIYGVGAGGMAHITDITGTAITIDEAILTTPGTGTFAMFLNNWKKIGSAITDNTKDYAIFDIPETAFSDYIQIKVAFTGFQIEELQLGYKPNLILET